MHTDNLLAAAFGNLHAETFQRAVTGGFPHVFIGNILIYCINFSVCQQQQDFFGDAYGVPAIEEMMIVCRYKISEALDHRIVLHLKSSQMKLCTRHGSIRRQVGIHGIWNTCEFQKLYDIGIGVDQVYFFLQMAMAERDKGTKTSHMIGMEMSNDNKK